jgi:cysteinyl-tRNA synthetase
MSDKLKAKFASLFFPKPTVMTAKPEADMSAKNEQDQPGQDTNSASVDAGTNTGITTGFTSTGTNTDTGTDNEASDHHIAVVFSDRDERARKQQTLESERARDELLAHGIKVRDFQAEADAKKYGEQR